MTKRTSITCIVCAAVFTVASAFASTHSTVRGDGNAAVAGPMVAASSTTASIVADKAASLFPKEAWTSENAFGFSAVNTTSPTSEKNASPPLAATAAVDEANNFTAYATPARLAVLTTGGAATPAPLAAI